MAGVEHMLERIEDQHDALVTQCINQALPYTVTTAFRNVERLGDRV